MLKYIRLSSENDDNINDIVKEYEHPNIACYISIDRKNYFKYVTETANVCFYKVYREGELVGTTHLELNDKTLYMDIVIFPTHQRQGIGTQILEDIQCGKVGIDFDEIEISIDESNLPSRRLFEKMGFVAVSRDDELINYLWRKNSLIPM